MLRYIIMIPILGLLALEIYVFVKIITKYRKRYVPALTVLAIFLFNFLMCCGLARLPLTPPPIPLQPAATTSPLPSPTPPPAHR